MSNINLIGTFAKGKEKVHKSTEGQNAVIYTRVSTKEQADTNQSLDTQKKYCNQYAEKNKFNVIGYFGGTYESAKTDERNEFNRMIKFVKNLKEKVSFILVYSLDRFSRTGDNAIYISSQLKLQGISIVAVTQPIDVSTVSGVLQQNIQFIFSKYDNDLRREKSVSGMKEKLLRGEWMGPAPVGYKYISDFKSKNQQIVISDDGKLLKKAFEWKAKEKITHREVVDRLAKLGLHIKEKRLTDTFRNPFYCGYVSHNLLEGKVVKGKHEALISEQLFLEVNEVISKNASGFKSSKENDNLPMRRFIICEECETPFTGYLRIKKQKNGNVHHFYYYKCNTTGCKINRSVPKMHEGFAWVLEKFQINPKYSTLIRAELEKAYYDLAGSDIENQRIIKLKISELKDKLEKLDERFGYGEIERDLHEKLSSKLRNEISSIQMELQKAEVKLSNPSELINKIVSMCCKLKSLWNDADAEDKKIIQDLFFPECVTYNGENDQYRTHNVNVVLELTSLLSEYYEQNKKREIKNIFDLPASVPSAGIEPASPCEHRCLRPARLPVPPAGHSICDRMI
jgi:site-specific DNA recombinase